MITLLRRADSDLRKITAIKSLEAKEINVIKMKIGGKR